VQKVVVKGDICVKLYRNERLECVISEKSSDWDFTLPDTLERFCYDSYGQSVAEFPFPDQIEMMPTHRLETCRDQLDLLTNAELSYWKNDTTVPITECNIPKEEGLCDSNNKLSAEEQRIFDVACHKTCTMCNVNTRKHYQIKVVPKTTSFALNNGERIPVKVSLKGGPLDSDESKVFDAMEEYVFDGDYECGSRIQLVAIPSQPYNHGEVVCTMGMISKDGRIDTDGNVMVSGDIEVTFQCMNPPTSSPSVSPSVAPVLGTSTQSPTPMPTMQPTAEPTVQPTVQPTAEPTMQPTEQCFTTLNRGYTHGNPLYSGGAFCTTPPCCAPDASQGVWYIGRYNLGSAFYFQEKEVGMTGGNVKNREQCAQWCRDEPQCDRANWRYFNTANGRDNWSGFGYRCYLMGNNGLRTTDYLEELAMPLDSAPSCCYGSGSRCNGQEVCDETWFKNNPIREIQFECPSVDTYVPQNWSAGTPSDNCAHWWMNNDWGANQDCGECDRWGRYECGATCCAHCPL